MGGEIWEIKREKYEYHGHSTEMAMIDIVPDKIILNNGTIQTLTKWVNEAMKNGGMTDNNDVAGDILYGKPNEST